MMIRKNTAGFTLVEIMIVVAIIGLLAAIAVPNFVQARTSARTSACINNLRLVDAAKEQWALANNANDGDPVAESGANSILDYLKGNIMPQCPAGGEYTVGAVSEPPVCDVEGHELAAAAAGS